MLLFLHLFLLLPGEPDGESPPPPPAAAAAAAVAPARAGGAAARAGRGAEPAAGVRPGAAVGRQLPPPVLLLLLLRGGGAALRAEVREQDGPAPEVRLVQGRGADGRRGGPGPSCSWHSQLALVTWFT